MRRALDALYAASAGLAALSLFSIFVVMMSQAVLREAHLQFAGADDLAAFLCVSTTFFALGATFKRGELIRVGMVLDRMSAPRRRVMEMMVLALAALLTGYVTFWTGQDVLFSWEIEELSQGTVPFQMWIPKLAMPLGSGILLIAILDELVAVWRGEIPSYVRAAQERAAAGDFSAEV